MSEADYPFEVVNWGGLNEITSDYLRRQAGAGPGAPIKDVSPDKFFAMAISEPEWKPEEEVATARRYQALLRLLKENLDGLKVYKVGEINIAVYIVGRAASGNLLGLSTRVVET
ncbi:MAG TPA: nuclease A inhibitor family protein [Pyrinomonadaceae bacterium]